jgi:SP family sugar:H+ symporter-like MFS transporter
MPQLLILTPPSSPNQNRFHVGSIVQWTCRLGSQSPHNALSQLYVGRAIGGLGVGLVSVVVPTVSSRS